MSVSKIVVVAALVLATGCGEPDYANDPVARLQLLESIIAEFDLPYSPSEMAGTASAICAWLDGNLQLPGSEGRYADDYAREYLLTLSMPDHWPGSATKYLIMYSIIHINTPVEEWPAENLNVRTVAGAIIIVDTFPLADLWCPHHQEQLDNAL